MKLTKVLPILLISIIWFLYLGFREGMDLGSIIGSILGGVLFVFGIPYSIAVLTIKKVSVDYQKRRFNRFITIWAVLIFMQIIVKLYGNPNSSLTFKYSPEGSIYEIEFMEKPKISEISTTDGKAILKAEVAELVMIEDKGYVKSEFIFFGKDTVKHFSTDALYDILKQYSISNGLSNPEFRNSENKLGKQVDLRGYKTLKDKDLNDRHLIMTAHLYFKENNVMILYGVSEAKDYPTPGITKFLNSISLK